MPTIIVLAAIALFVVYILKKPGVKKRPPANRTQEPRQPRAPRPAPITSATVHWTDGGNYDFEVVGESYYQSALRSLAGNDGEFIQVQKVATLVPQDSNPYDSQAVAVMIDDSIVGYLSREEARGFRRRLAAKKLGKSVTTTDAVITGGAKVDGRHYHYGVRLDMKPF